MWVYCSSGVSCVGCRVGPQPTQPTTSMSGSFQRPGPAYGAFSTCAKPISLMLFQVSVMSPVVRQRLPPTSSPHSQTSPMPYWHRL